MACVRLIRRVAAPTGCGPGNGQFALQRALRAHAPQWLRVGGALRRGEIPWFWCWADREVAASCAQTGQPFVAGPNVLFADSHWPCGLAVEREICEAASCRLLFTESAWYREVIRQHLGPANRATIVLWTYPIEPKPGGPLPAEHDLLIYEKSGVDRRVVAGLRRAWPRSVRVRYGHYRREQLFELARQSRCCVYFSDDDRGPLALAEVLLAGCPAVGIPRGAPFVQPGRTGVLIERFSPDACCQAVAVCQQLDREAVAALAAEQLDTARTVSTIISALDRCR